MGKEEKVGKRESVGPPAGATGAPMALGAAACAGLGGRARGVVGAGVVVVVVGAAVGGGLVTGANVGLARATWAIGPTGCCVRGPAGPGAGLGCPSLASSSYSYS